MKFLKYKIKKKPFMDKVWWLQIGKIVMLICRHINIGLEHYLILSTLESHHKNE